MVYIVETEDYNLAIYNSEEDFKNKKDKPKQKISLAGYKLTKEPRKDYEKVAKELAMALGKNFYSICRKRSTEQHPLNRVRR